MEISLEDLIANLAQDNDRIPSATYRVWIMWSDRSDVLIDLAGPTPEAVQVCAVRMGYVSGLGTNPRYLGLHTTLLTEAV